MTDRQVTELLFVDDGPEPADIALVFGCVEPKESRQRARHAASLFHAGLVPRLLLSGGVSHPDRPESEAGLMLGVVLDLGVPREVVLVEDRSRSTFENVSNSATLHRDLDLLGSTRTILLVSCPWHMRWVSQIARAGFPQHVRLRCCPPLGVLHRRDLGVVPHLSGSGGRRSGAARRLHRRGHPARSLAMMHSRDQNRIGVPRYARSNRSPSRQETHLEPSPADRRDGHGLLVPDVLAVRRR